MTKESRTFTDLLSKVRPDKDTKVATGTKSRPARARLPDDTAPDDTANRNTINAIEHAIDQIEAGRRRRHHHCHPHGAHAGGYGPLLSQPEHPQHALFRQTRDAVHRLDAEHGRAPDERSENLAGALAVAAHREGMDRVDHVALSHDASQAFAIQGELQSPHKQVAQVTTSEAVATSLASSSQAMATVAASRVADTMQDTTATQLAPHTPHTP